MNFTYFKFLFVTTIKKRPVWITWLLYLFTASAFLLILPAVARMNTLQVWANTTMAVCQTFLGMTVALFTAVLSIHVFKDGLEEGTELIIMSKPISRLKVTLTKIFIFGFFCLLVNASSLIITAFTIFLPTTETKFYWGLIVSMLIGNLIAFGVFGSIAVLLSVNMAKVGVIITNIMISLIFLIYQCLTLFVFSIPIRSLADHGMTAPSYITTNRNLDSGDYKEEEYVCFKTNVAKQMTEVDEKERNYSTNWRETKQYWTDVICKNDPTLVLNITDLAGQISLSYLSVGISDYAFRQGHRMFAISRFYTYDLVSPSSPEIIEDIPNKKSLPWVYTNDTSYDLQILGDTYSFPKTVGFAGIAPLGTTRLRGYGDQIPIGFYVRTGEALSSKDVFFEADEWKKYKKPFELICDKLFEYELYENQVSASIKDQPWEWGSAWASNNSTLTRYYELLWSCFTGHSAEEKYFNNDFLKDYTKEYFSISSVNDLNERFLQFKYYIYYRILREQQELFRQKATSNEEAAAKAAVCNDESYKSLESTLHIKHFDDNWMVQSDGTTTSLIPSFIEPGTETLNIDLINRTVDELYYQTDKKFKNNDITLKDKQDILRNSTYSKLHRTMSMFNHVADTNEEFLFNSLEEPSRSAAYHGKSYMVTSDWIPYWETLLTPNGHNMQWFYYTSRETVNYWVYAVIWGAISLGLFSAGAIVYNKFDVK